VNAIAAKNPLAMPFQTKSPDYSHQNISGLKPILRIAA
jgi:hypothetical protein